MATTNAQNLEQALVGETQQSILLLILSNNVNGPLRVADRPVPNQPELRFPQQLHEDLNKLFNFKLQDAAGKLEKGYETDGEIIKALKTYINNALQAGLIQDQTKGKQEVERILNKFCEIITAQVKAQVSDDYLALCLNQKKLAVEAREKGLALSEPRLKLNNAIKENKPANVIAELKENVRLAVEAKADVDKRLAENLAKINQQQQKLRHNVAVKNIEAIAQFGQKLFASPLDQKSIYLPDTGAILLRDHKISGFNAANAIAKIKQNIFNDVLVATEKPNFSINMLKPYEQLNQLVHDSLKILKSYSSGKSGNPHKIAMLVTLTNMLQNIAKKPGEDPQVLSNELMACLQAIHKASVTFEKSRSFGSLRAAGSSFIKAVSNIVDNPAYQNIKQEHVSSDSIQANAKNVAARMRANSISSSSSSVEKSEAINNANDQQPLTPRKRPGG